jgi:hypothetical protein
LRSSSTSAITGGAASSDMGPLVIPRTRLGKGVQPARLIASR